MTLRTLGIVTTTATTLALTLAPLAASALTLGAHVGADASTTGAHIGAHASSTVKIDARITQAKEHGDKEIDRRIENLQKLSARIGDMKRLSASQQTTLTASIASQIDVLTSLKAKIDADDSTTTLKADIQSITAGYRIYALVMPQIAITAASDRALSLATLMTQFSAKLSARIDAASTTDKTALQAALDDYNAKVADAKIQAQAAIDAVAVLKPDNGDATVKQANQDVLKGARAKVQAAQQDLVAARKDATTIIKGVGGKLELKANATTTASV